MMFAKVGKFELHLKLAGGESFCCRGRNQNLICVGGSLQSIDRWQRGAKKVATPRSRHAGVDAAPHQQPPGRTPGHPAHLALRVDRRQHGIDRPLENREDAVAGVLERIAMAATNRGMKNLVVQVHRSQHVVGITAVQSGATGNIRCQKRPFRTPRY